MLFVWVNGCLSKSWCRISFSAPRQKGRWRRLIWYVMLWIFHIKVSPRTREFMRPVWMIYWKSCMKWQKSIIEYYWLATTLDWNICWSTCVQSYLFQKMENYCRPPRWPVLVQTKPGQSCRLIQRHWCLLRGLNPLQNRLKHDKTITFYAYMVLPWMNIASFRKDCYKADTLWLRSMVFYLASIDRKCGAVSDSPNICNKNAMWSVCQFSICFFSWKLITS